MDPKKIGRVFDCPYCTLNQQLCIMMTEAEQQSHIENVHRELRDNRANSHSEARLLNWHRPSEAENSEEDWDCCDPNDWTMGLQQFMGPCDCYGRKLFLQRQRQRLEELQQDPLYDQKQLLLREQFRKRKLIADRILEESKQLGEAVRLRWQAAISSKTTTASSVAAVNSSVASTSTTSSENEVICQIYYSR